MHGLATLLDMIGELGKDERDYVLGYMAAKAPELATEAMASLVASDAYGIS